MFAHQVIGWLEGNRLAHAGGIVLLESASSWRGCGMGHCRGGGLGIPPVRYSSMDCRYSYSQLLSHLQVTASNNGFLMTILTHLAAARTDNEPQSYPPSPAHSTVRKHGR